MTTFLFHRPRRHRACQYKRYDCFGSNKMPCFFVLFRTLSQKFRLVYKQTFIKLVYKLKDFNSYVSYALHFYSCKMLITNSNFNYANKYDFFSKFHFLKFIDENMNIRQFIVSLLNKLYILTFLSEHHRNGSW